MANQADCQVRGPMPPEPEHKVIKFYPNPAVSYITFELARDANNKTFTLQIFSFLGRMVKNVPDISDKTTVQLSDLTRGLYTFQLKDETGRTTDSGIFQIIK
ncbi:MAG TPA: T9SS type A sorting domain-containing protein [Puia sp.]|nr:T9SS type A sorting domain-containing protein [Puia sp.]